MKARGDGIIAEDDVGYSQLSIDVDKNLSLQYPYQVSLVDKTKVGIAEYLSVNSPRVKALLEYNTGKIRTNLLMKT